MKFLKTHTGAMVVLAVVIVLSVLLGSHRSLVQAREKVEAQFAPIAGDLQDCLDITANLLTVAGRYLDEGELGEAGPHQFPGEYQPEPVQGMPHRQIADEADQGGAAVEDVLNPAQAAQQGQVFFRQGLGGAGLYVLAGGEQLVLRHL